MLKELVKTHVSTVWAQDHYRNDRDVRQFGRSGIASISRRVRGMECIFLSGHFVKFIFILSY